MSRPSLIALLALAALAALLVPALAAGAAAGDLELRVFVDGQDASSSPGPEVTAGEQIIVTYEVRNMGSETLYALYLRQDGIGRVTCPDRTLSPGELVVCEVSVIAEDGARADLARATAWPDGIDGVSDSATVHYVGRDTGSSWQNLAVTGTATQSDTQQWNSANGPHKAIDGNRDGDIDAGSVTVTYRVSNAWWELDLGSVRSIDHIVLWNRTDCCSQRLHDFHVFVSDSPFEVKDIKNTQTQRGVSDYFHSGVAGRRTEIAVGRTGRYVRVQLDYTDAVLQLAEVEVMGGAPPAPPAPPTIAFEARVNGKRADRDPGPAIAPGSPVTFTYEVTNTGTTMLWATYVRHDGVGTATCRDRSMEPGETVTCTIETTARAGAHATDVVAKAWDDDGVEARTTDPVYYVGSDGNTTNGPALDLEVSVNGTDADQAPGPSLTFGEPITFTYEVTNVGTENLWSLYLTHDGRGTVTTCPTRTLRVGDSVTCEVGASAGAGQQSSKATASAWAGDGTRASDIDSVNYATKVSADSRSLSVAARIDGDDADTSPGPIIAPGSRAELAVDVTNTGATELWGVWVDVPGFGIVTCNERHLRPGDSTTCSKKFTAQSGLFSANARVVGYDDGGDTVEGSDPVRWFVPEGSGPSVYLDFLVDGLNGDTPWGPRIEEGETLNFFYLVENTGATTLTDIAVSDDTNGAIACPKTSLSPGGSMVCTLKKTARLIRTTILATVDARGAGQSVSDSERLYYHVKPYGRRDELTLEVSIDGRDADSPSGPQLEVGRTATIRYILTNNSYEASLYSAEIIDPWVSRDQMNCSGGPYLGHYMSMVCTATIVIKSGQRSNVVTAHAWSQNGPRIDTSDRIHYYGVQ